MPISRHTVQSAAPRGGIWISGFHLGSLGTERLVRAWGVPDKLGIVFTYELLMLLPVMRRLMEKLRSPARALVSIVGTPGNIEIVTGVTDITNIVPVTLDRPG